MPWRERIVAVAAAVGTAYALLIGGSAGGVLIPGLRLFNDVVAGGALAIWLIAAWAIPSWRPRSALLPILLLGLASLTISTIFSRSQRISGENLAHAIVLAGLYLLLVELLRRPALRARVVSVAALTGIVLSALYIGVVFSKWLEFWGLVGHLSAPPLRPDFVSLMYDNPAPVLAMCTILSSVAVAWASELGRFRIAITGAAVVLAAIAVILTGTRAGWFAVGAAALVTAGLALAQPGARAWVGAVARRWRLGRRGVLILVGGSGVLIIAAVVVLAPGFLRRAGAGGEDVRASFYVAALRMFLDAPLIGVGPGMWAVDRIAYTQPPEIDYAVPHAHDVYLQGLAETGLVGLVVGSIGVAVILWLLRDGLRSSDPWRRRWAWAACFTSAYFALHQVFEFYFNLPAVMIAAAVPVAILDATATSRPMPGILQAGRTPSSTRRLPSRPFAVLGTLVLAVAIVASGWADILAVRAGDAVGLVNAGYWAQAAQPAAQAVRDDPAMPANVLVDALVAAHAGELDRAEAGLREVAEFGDLSEAWLDVAAIELGAGRQAAAAQDLARAARLGTERPAVAIAISYVALDLGDRDLAVEAAAAAVAALPTLAADPWWVSDPGRAAIYRPVLERALQLADQAADPDASWEIALMAGDVQRALTLAARSPDPALSQEVIGAWTGDAQARSLVYAACSGDPVNGPIAWCARLANRAGDEAATARYQEWARILRVADVPGEARVVMSPTQPTTAGGVAYTYPVAVFRRFGIWDLLVPGLPHLTLQ